MSVKSLKTNRWYKIYRNLHNNVYWQRGLLYSEEEIEMISLEKINKKYSMTLLGRCSEVNNFEDCINFKIYRVKNKAEKR